MSSFVRLYTGEDGQSHFEDMNPPFIPFVDTEGASGEGTTLEAVSGVTFRIGPPGYELRWHNAPRRQYVITLAGRSEIEISGGTVRQFGAGDVLLAEDLTGEGHITRVVGDEPRHTAVVQID